MALTFPQVDPIAIALGPVQIRWYALSYLAGILLGWAYARYIVRKDAPVRPNVEDIDDYLPFAVLGVILGGRLGYILFYQPAYYLQHPMEILQLWNGGMSFHGGAAGVIASLIIYAVVKKFSMFRLGDIAALCCTIGLFFGRVANFINGELYGRATDAPWGIVFPGGGAEPRHPSQLYEAVLEGLMLFIILSILAHNKWVRERPGIIGGTFLAGYGAARMFVENFREPDWYLGFVVGQMTMGQLLCVPMILVGLSFIIRGIKSSPFRERI